MAVPAVPRFHITGSSSPSPPSARTVYVDGSGPAAAFRPEVDLELSHWVPTTTPERWAADTSTEICVRFLADPPDDVDEYDLVVNNHCDVDGILSVFCLVHPDVALAHRDAVVGAAEVGDLAAWAEWPAFRLAQELTAVMGGLGAPGRDPCDTYAAAFDQALAVLADAHPAPADVRAGWDLLVDQADGLDGDGPVTVSEHGPRLVSYVLPPAEGPELVAALRVPPFNTMVDDTVALWPHARNRRHGQAAQLVSVPVAGGWTHDLWLPGYVWAHTPDRWRPPVLEDRGDANTWRIEPDPLSGIVEALGADEPRPGTWALAPQIDPFTALSGRGFPVIVSFVDDDGAPVPSGQRPEQVARRLAPAFTSR